MLFTNKSANYVDVTYLRYFRDLELVSNYAWGAAAIAHLHMEINNGLLVYSLLCCSFCCRLEYFNTSGESVPGMDGVDTRTINIHVP